LTSSRSTSPKCRRSSTKRSGRFSGRYRWPPRAPASSWPDTHEGEAHTMEQAKSLDPKVVYGPIVGNRWIQLIAGVVAMIVISNFQYAFTLFTPGLKASFPNVAYKDIALILTLFILFETWPVPLAGHFIDKFGIRKLMLVGATCILLGWVLGGTVATTVFHLYIFYGVLTGTGAGIIYIATVANAVKWFPDRRGLAAGLTAAGFGSGAGLTLIPISAPISGLGWRHDHMGAWPGRRCHRGGAGSTSSTQGLGTRGLDATQGGRANEGGIYLDADADEGRVLPLVRHVSHGLYRRSDDDRKPVADREVPQSIRREGPGYRPCPLYGDHRGSDECLRPDHVGRAFRQVRARVYDGLCLRVRRSAHLPDDTDHGKSHTVRSPAALCLPGLGRNICPLLGDNGRRLRRTERLGQLWHLVHGQGAGFDSRRVRRGAGGRTLCRLLPGALLYLGGIRHHCGDLGPFRIETDH